MADDIYDKASNPRLVLAAADAVLGDVIGSGCYRTVYALKYDPTRVLKLETDGTEFCNAIEWRIWRDVQGTKWEKWFAPCYGIDRWGCALIQARTEPLTKWPEGQTVPAFFHDTKPENWGHLDGRIVCHDYAAHSLNSRGMAGSRLVKPKIL